MKTFSMRGVGSVCILLASSAAFTQPPATPTASPDPSAASSPRPHDVTGSGTAAAPADPSSSGPAGAPSPHQDEAMHGTQRSRSMAAESAGADPAAFVVKAAQGGMTEVALSKAAATKASDPNVKSFAEQMVQDHQKANDELTAMAHRKGLSVPASLDAEHQAIVQKINNKNGTEFDQAYGKQMALDHAKTVALFQSERSQRIPISPDLRRRRCLY